MGADLNLGNGEFAVDRRDLAVVQKTSDCEKAIANQYI